MFVCLICQRSENVTPSNSNSNVPPPPQKKKKNDSPIIKKVIKAEAVCVCDENSAKHAMHCSVVQFAPTINDFFQISTG